MKGLGRGDKTWVIMTGCEQDRFWLSGTPKQALQGVELARGIVGLDKPPTELVWLQEAHQNGADLVGANVDVRKIKGAVNILGNTPREVRDVYGRWNRNNSFTRLSRLWFINSYSGIRFSDVLLGESTTDSLDTDPALLKRITAYSHTWVAPNPYYKGYTDEFEFKVTQPDNLGWSYMYPKIRNMGDAKTYPRIELPGPGEWVIPRGTRLPNYRGEEQLGELDGEEIPLPRIGAGDKIILNTDPRSETISKIAANGKETNLWAEMNGLRPRIKLLGDRSEVWPFRVSGGSPNKVAKFIVQPLYSTFF